MPKRILLLLFFFILTVAAHGQKAYASLNHIGIYVSDTKASAAFYMKLFHLDSLKKIAPGQPAIWLKLGKTTELHLIQGSKQDILIAPHNHVAFSVRSLYDFTILLQKENIYYEGEPGKVNTFVVRADGVKQIYLKDPDGYMVEVNDAAY